MRNVLSDTVLLPCGQSLKNRLVKSAMSDSLADGEGDATDRQARLYERWAQGGVALSVVGEVQVDCRFPEKPGNLVLSDQSDLVALRALTRRATINNTHIWAQLGHAGALSDPAISQPAGPSALDLEGLQCRAMSSSEIKALPSVFAKAALLAKEAGFTGVQIHAAHGFLLSQFLSPLFNHREDDYGGLISSRCRIVIEIVESVRGVVGSDFPIGIKINSSDQLEGGLEESEALELIALLNDTSVDLIDISGGTYFPGAKASSDASGSGPYFLAFAKKARQLTRIPLMLTGGFKTHHQVLDVIDSDIVDCVGLARAMIVNPSLPNAWLKGKGDPIFPRFTTTPPGGVTAWYTMSMTAISEDQDQVFLLDLPSAIDLYDARDAQRRDGWLKKFSV
ncbi:oxidoreductase [Marinomonas sp.]|nr:oxidoreductase [Marinomonas sp.]MDB4837673.1 oxidoreductase [Marinomonas sp.]